MNAVFLAVPLFLAGNPTEPVAMVLTTTGQPTVQRAKQEPRRAGAMFLLVPGDEVRVPDGGEMTVVFLDDGHRERLRSAAQATVSAKGFEPVGKAERLEGPALSPVSLRSLKELARSARGGIGVLRSDERSGKIPVLTPMYGANILTNTPSLSWPAQAGADGYVVHILGGAEGPNQQKIWQSPPTKETKLAYPKEKPLAVGLLYHWRVYPLKGEERGDPIVISKFSIATNSEQKILAPARSLQESKAPADWLVAASLYEAHGVYDEALRLYEKLAAQAPHEPGFQVALASYYTRAGQPERAAQARAAAKKLGAAIDP